MTNEQELDLIHRLHTVTSCDQLLSYLYELHPNRSDTFYMGYLASLVSSQNKHIETLTNNSIQMSGLLTRAADSLHDYSELDTDNNHYLAMEINAALDALTHVKIEVTTP